MEFKLNNRFLVRKCLTIFPVKFGATVLISLMIGGPALAAGVEWTLTPTAELRQNYTDNFNLTDFDALDVWSTQISGGLKSNYQSDRWVVGTDLRYLHEQFWGDDNNGNSNTSLNRDDAEVSLASTYNISQYWQFDLNGSYRRDQPRSSQIDTEAFQTEQVFDRITRLTGTINPGLTWHITERTELGIIYEFIDVSYSDVENLQTQTVFPQSGAEILNTSGQTDFFRHVGALTLTHQLAEPTSIIASAGYNRTVNDEQRTENDQYILSVGIDHSFSDTFSAAVTAGGIWLNSDSPEVLESELAVDVAGNPVIDDDTGIQQTIAGRSADRTDSDSELGYLVNLALRKKFEYSEFTGSYSHNFNPTSTGGILEEDRVTLNLRHDWTEYFSSTANLFGSVNSRIGNGRAAIENGRKSAAARLELAWRFAENLFLAGGYRYRWQNQDSRDGRDSSNDVFVSVRYDWDPYFALP